MHEGDKNLPAAFLTLKKSVSQPRLRIHRELILVNITAISVFYAHSQTWSAFKADLLFAFPSFTLYKPVLCDHF